MRTASRVLCQFREFSNGLFAKSHKPLTFAVPPYRFLALACFVFSSHGSLLRAC